jgi:hypothetical protein
MRAPAKRSSGVQIPLSPSKQAAIFGILWRTPQNSHGCAQVERLGVLIRFSAEKPLLKSLPG